jgi:hypothetical protein
MELAVILTFTVMFTLMFFLIGGIIGWIVKQYQFERMYGIPNLHPEMFDSNGNVVPDEILAVRFENDYDYDHEDEDEE